MKKSLNLFKIIATSVLALPIVLMIHSTAFSAKDKSKPVPMDLDKTEWLAETVEVTEKGKKITGSDTLKFEESKFVSQKFEDKGYEPTNYSLTLEEDGTTRFGTMQIKGKETSFWKGKVKGDVLDGSVHTQYASGSTKTVYYTAKLTSGALKPKVKEKPKKPTPPPPPPPPAAAKPVETKLEVTVVPDVAKDSESAPAGKAPAETVDQ